MDKQSSLRLAIGAVAVGVLLPVAAVFYGLGLSDTDVQKVGSAATLGAAIGGLIGLVVLVVYTREALLLRKTAEAQNEGNIKPIVRLDFHLTNDTSEGSRELVFQLE